jgi:hypothetical protein
VDQSALLQCIEAEEDEGKGLGYAALEAGGDHGGRTVALSIGVCATDEPDFAGSLICPVSFFTASRTATRPSCLSIRMAVVGLLTHYAAALHFVLHRVPKQPPWHLLRPGQI